MHSDGEPGRERYAGINAGLDASNLARDVGKQVLELAKNVDRLIAIVEEQQKTLSLLTKAVAGLIQGK